MKALIQNENGLLINGDSYATPDTIRIDNTAYSFVVSANEDIIIGDTNSGYMIALNEDGDSGQSVDLPTAASGYATYFDVATKVYVTTSITDGNPLTQTASFSSYFTTDVPVTDGDRAKLNANNNLIYDLWFGSTITGLSFTKANVINFVPATEGYVGRGWLQDLSVELGTEEATNGTFDTDTDWNKGTGWTISGGEAHCDGTQTADSPFSQNSGIEVGKLYSLIYDITARSTGGITPKIGGTDGKLKNTVTTHTDIILTTSNTYINMVANSTFVGSIDNVSVKEVTAYEIANYTDTCRTFYTDEVYGFQNVLADQDASGRITGMADITTVDMIEPLRVRSPDGTVWIITVDDLGAVSAVEEV